MSTDINNMPCWYFERKEIKNSPSFRDGIDTATENRYRREGARFIIDAGTKMGLLYDTCATGVVYFHRFYMFHSFKEFYRYVTAACCLFLAGKVEETPKKCKDIIKIAQSLLSSASFLRFGEDPREEVMTMERILLKTIKFDLQVEHPYGCMLKFAKNFKGDKEKTQKMAQMAWTFINDSLCTTLCLQWEPEIVAVSLMYLASRLTKFEPSDWTGREGSKSKWWEDFIEGMSMELMEDICHQVLDLYSSKQKKTAEGDSPPQSPIKGNRQPSSPPPPPPAERTFAKRSREDVSSEAELPSKIGKVDKDTKTSTAQSSTSNTSGAPIPVAQHITPSSGNHPSYSIVEHGGGIDFSSYNPYVSSQMYASSFMSQEGSQNIQSILAGNAPPPTNVYADHHVHHSQSTDSSQYPPIPQTDMTYSYPPPQPQYNAPPSLSHQHPYPSISNVATSAAPPYDPYTVPPNPAQYPTPSYPPTSVSQPPPQHSYPPPSIPPTQVYGSFYSPANHSSGPPNQLIPTPRLSNYPSHPTSYSSHPQPVSSAQSYGQSRNQGSYQKLGTHNPGGQRKDATALTEVKISGRTEWNQQK
uniref:Cyclin-like domain-containing protein n=3 Tax=Arion vulgaris TaxID=1028688 RepID=A0A0B7B060_9EUPU